MARMPLDTEAPAALITRIPYDPCNTVAGPHLRPRTEQTSRYYLRYSGAGIGLS